MIWCALEFFITILAFIIVMPRKPALSIEEIYSVLKDFSFVDASNHFLPSSHKIWVKASLVLNKKMSPLHIYKYITRNQYGISDKIHGCRIKNQRSKYNKKIFSDKVRSIEKKIVFTQDEWIRMGVNVQNFNGRTRHVFTRGWTDIISKSLWSNFKISCAYAFKTCTITGDDNHKTYDIKGYCSECGNNIHLLNLTDCTEKGIEFSISTRDCQHIKHHKKRQLKGLTRTKVCQELNGKSAELWRLETASREMNFGDADHPSLYSSNVLRKAKQLQKDKNSGLDRQSDAVEAIYDLKYQQGYENIIHNISARRFYATYWLPEQVTLYKSFTEIDSFVTISIDATGSIIKSLKKSDGSTCNIFLYQAVAHFFHRTVPIFQMLSEKHDTNILLYWMNQWISAGVPKPRQIVTDYSLALINASTLAFNQKTLEQYVIHCYNIIISVTSMNENITLHRIDIAHFIKFISRWKCLNNHKHKNIKTFYLYCMGVLIKSTNFEDFKKILNFILIVANFPRYSNVNIKSKYSDAHSYLLKCIETTSLSAINNINITNNNNCNHDKTSEEFINIEVNHHNFQEFYESISQEMTNIEDGNQENMYYCPDFAEKLLKLTKTFVLWTNIMPHLYFQSNFKTVLESDQHELDKIYTASSARSEQYFCKLKTIIMNDGKLGRIDEFLIKHIQSLKGDMNLAMEDYLSLFDSNDPSSISNKISIYNQSNRSSYQSISDNCIPIDTSSNDTCNQKNEVLGETLLSCEKSIVLSDGEEIFEEYNSNEEYSLELNQASFENLNCIKMERCVKLLKNGSTMPSVETSKGFLLFIKNTCAFDSIVECLAAGYHQFLTFREHINGSNNGLFKLIRLLWTSNDSSLIYRIRADLLSKGKKIENDSLDCVANSCSIVQLILHEEPSVRIDIECKECTRNRHIKLPVLSPDMENIWDNGITCLQETINYWLINFIEKYKVLNHSEIINIRNGHHLFIDLEGVHCRSSYVQKNFKEIPLVCLNMIPVNLIFYEQKYHLVGAIEHKILTHVDHYKSLIRYEKTGWYCYDDCSSHPQKLEHASLITKRSVSVLFYVKC